MMSTVVPMSSLLKLIFPVAGANLSRATDVAQG